MAEPCTELLTAGLARLKGSLDGLPLLTARNSPGAFANNAAGKQAARLCQERSWVRLLPSSSRPQLFTLTEAGDRWLAEQAAPDAALHEIAAALGQRCERLDALQAVALDHQRQLSSLQTWIEGLLARMQNERRSDGPLPAEVDILGLLRAAEIEQPLKDCALPELFARVRQHRPHLSVGEFHDACRRLLERGRIYVHPWTGPLFEMPEPALAFLAGHEIAYYVSLRRPTTEGIGYHCALAATVCEAVSDTERISP